MVPAFLNGAIGSRIPDKKVWMDALRLDPMTNQLLEIAVNLGLSNDKTAIDSLHYIYRHPARNGHFTLGDGSLYMKEIFTNGVKFIKLRIVPASLQNIVFIAFHANPIVGILMLIARITASASATIGLVFTPTPSPLQGLPWMFSL